MVSRAPIVLLTWIHPHAEDLANPAFRKPILDEFGRQLMIMKSSCLISGRTSPKGGYHIPGDQLRVPLCHFSPGFLPDPAEVPGSRPQIKDGMLEQTELIVRLGPYLKAISVLTAPPAPSGWAPSGPSS